MKIGQDTSGSHISIWLRDTNRENFPAITHDLRAEIGIIGAGIAGLTTAYRLVKEGKSVVVIDDGKIASGESGRTSAHLSNILDDRYFNLIKLHGYDNAALAAKSHTAAIQFIEDICQQENIDCEFARVNGYLFLDKTSSYEILKNEFEATQKLGLLPEFIKKSTPDTFKMDTAIMFPQQAQFHPLKYLNQLAKIIQNNGGIIYENVRASKFEKGNPIKITTNTDKTITVDKIVFATNSPINNRFGIHTKQEANRTYVIGCLIPKNSVEAALYWDTADPYHYIRVHSGDYQYNHNPCDLLIIGGEDHRTGQNPTAANRCFENLKLWANHLFPNIVHTEYRWSGQIIEPIDYLAFIGYDPAGDKNSFIATGDSGNGLTHGTIAGILISDLILHHQNEWEKIYKTTRKSIKAWQEFIKINLQSIVSYFDYLKTQPTKNVEAILPGEGAVINKGFSKIAVYRDNDGVLHKHSAICPHLKALVRWNACEKTWDCPAHGSRFTGEGCVINGPANHSLTPIKIK